MSFKDLNMLFNNFEGNSLMGRRVFVVVNAVVGGICAVMESMNGWKCRGGVSEKVRNVVCRGFGELKLFGEVEG
jgi:hypothetical protein